MIVSCRILPVIILCAALPAATLAGEITCEVSQAWRLEAGGLSPHPQGAAGYAEAARLTVDTTKGVLSTSAGPIKEAVMRSVFDDATGAGVIFSTPDASLVFRARRLPDGIPYMLMDTYDLYVGRCRE